MSPEKQTKMTNQKQKIMVGVTVVIIIFVVWQAIKLMGGGGESAAPTITPSNKTAQAQVANPASQPPAANNSNAAAAQVAQQQPEQQAPKQAPVQVNTEILKIQQETQGKYINALNELQMLKVQKEIAETKQAITSSILANATAEKSITDLLTVQQIPQSQQSNPFNPMATIAAPEPAATTAAAPAQPTMIVNKAMNSALGPQVPYVLVSVSFKGDRWKAVLSYKDVFYTVNVGDTLPPDGTEVLSIDRNGVTLTKDKINKRVPLESAL